MKQLSILAAALAIAVGQSYIGRLDTIGGTTYDWWTSHNVHRSLVNSPQYGIHAAWVYSASTSGTDFPDRNMRYNFYDYTIRQWNWTDPDYMQSGMNVFVHGAAANQEHDCTEGGNGGTLACANLTVLEILIQADGIKNVYGLTAELESYPLNKSARDATRAANP